MVLADDFIEVDTIPWAMINGRMMLACSSPADTEEVKRRQSPSSSFLGCADAIRYYHVRVRIQQ